LLPSNELLRDMSTISDDENEEFYDASDGTNDIEKAWDELMVIYWGFFVTCHLPGKYLVLYVKFFRLTQNFCNSPLNVFACDRAGDVGLLL